MLSQFIYLSDLSSDAEPQAISQIVKVSRINNEQDELTGILIFDGETFCQYLEGPKQALAKRLEIIKSDSRHENFTLLQHCEREVQRLFKTWGIAYATCFDITLREYFAERTGGEAFRHLEGMLPGLDLSPS